MVAQRTDFWDLFHNLEMAYGDNLIDGLDSKVVAEYSRDREGQLIDIKLWGRTFTIRSDGSVWRTDLA